jgi:predicted DNA repair protein MutK
MKTLAVVGTIAMFMVGGGILVHGLHPVHIAIEQFALSLGDISVAGGVLQAIAPLLSSTLFGVLAGGIAVGLMSLAQFARRTN